MHIEWWMWLVFGIITLSLEIMTPGGFYLMFVGIAAILTGALTPVINTSWIEILLFAVLSLFFIAVLRGPLARRIARSTPKADVQEFVGETGRALEAIAPGATGTVELRGSTWQARNDGAIALEKDGPCVVTARDGLKFIVKPK
jgi:inner membrane protein